MLMSFFSSAKQSGPDFNNIMTHAINISGHELTISFPGNLSNQWGPATVPPEQVDLYDESRYEVYFYRNSYKFLVRIWDYYGQKGKIKNEEIGHIHLRLNISKLDNRNDLSIANLDELKKIIFTQLFNYYDGPKGWNTKARVEYPNMSDEELGDYLRRIPKKEDFKEVNLNGKQWLKFSVWGEMQGQTTVYYAIPLSASHYFSASFLFRADGMYDPNWRAQAEADVERIASMIKLKYAD